MKNDQETINYLPANFNENTLYYSIIENSEKYFFEFRKNNQIIEKKIFESDIQLKEQLKFCEKMFLKEILIRNIKLKNENFEMKIGILGIYENFRFFDTPRISSQLFLDKFNFF